MTKEDMKEVETFIKDNKDGIYEIKVKKGKIVDLWHKKRYEKTRKKDKNMV